MSEEFDPSRLRPAARPDGRPRLRLVRPEPDPGQTAFPPTEHPAAHQETRRLPSAARPVEPSRAAVAFREASRAIARENRAAALLDPHDARLIVARRAAEVLEGGRAAILRPDRRRRLVRLATDLGLRPFDANLVIAIAQDAAREGRSPTGADAASRLGLVRLPDGTARPPRSSADPAAATDRAWLGRALLQASTAAVLAASAIVAAVWWITHLG